MIHKRPQWCFSFSPRVEYLVTKPLPCFLVVIGYGLFLVSKWDALEPQVTLTDVPTCSSFYCFMLTLRTRNALSADPLRNDRGKIHQSSFGIAWRFLTKNRTYVGN